MAQTSRRYVLLSLLMLWAWPPLQAGIGVFPEGGWLSEKDEKDLGIFLEKIRFIPEADYSKDYNISNAYRIYAEIQFQSRTRSRLNMEWEHTMKGDGTIEVDIIPALSDIPKTRDKAVSIQR